MRQLPVLEHQRRRLQHRQIRCPQVKESGTTTVTWNTGDGTDGQVYVGSPDGGPELLFAAGPTGSVPAPWIRAGKTGEFRLYAGTEHAKVLAKTQVTGQK